MAGTAFVEAAFGFGPRTSSLLAEPPRGRLGPRYAITFSMREPDGTDDRLRQDLYPYATPRPVTYVPWGQLFFGTQRTTGGWYVAPARFRGTLVRLGLPSGPVDRASEARQSSHPRLVALTAAIGALAVTRAALIVRRQSGGRVVRRAR